MDSVSLNQHLSQIQTLWTLVRQAQEGAADELQAAQERLLRRYGGAVKRYLLGALRDPDAADEAFQDFAYRLLHGDMRGADPERGRFRQFVKGVLFHLVADYHKKKKRLPHNLHPDAPEPEVADASTFEQDREFLRNWREELLRRAWAALEESDRESGKHFYKMLRLRAEHPDLSSTQLAELLSKALGKPINAAAGRQTLHRAREQFSDLMLDDVVQSLDNPTREQLEQELIDLGLLEYCRPALERRKDGDE